MTLALYLSRVRSSDLLGGDLMLLSERILKITNGKLIAAHVKHMGQANLIGKCKSAAYVIGPTANIQISALNAIAGNHREAVERNT